VEHHEPLLISGVDPARVEAVMHSYVGLDVTGITTIAGHRPIAIISGASVSMTVMGDSILRSAVFLLRQHHSEAAPLAAEAAPAPPAEDAAPLRDWSTLLADGAVRHLHLSVGEVSDAFAATTPEREGLAADFIDLYAAVIASAATGRSLLGEAGWQRLQAEFKPG
jgi:NosR/NirI family nitrous oxide reductase transcriptional regulator